MEPDPSIATYLQHLRKADGKEVYQAISAIHEEVFAETDCLTCANCCKTSPPIVTRKDAKRIAKSLGIPPKTFIRHYLIEDYDGSLMMNGVPCTFLQGDNTCKIYEVRPEACRRYPHTDELQFKNRPKLNALNTVVCPAAESIVRRLMQTMPL